jgi:hypothetical protein
MAMFDWTTASQATVYTQAADRKRLAAQTAPLMVRHFENSECPPKIN